MTFFFSAALIFGGLIGYNKASGGDLFGAGPQAIQIISAFLLIGGLGISILWWHSIDEAQREAHKWAWYWGGSTGLLAIIPLFLLARTGGDAVFAGYARFVDMEGHYFELGMLTALFACIIGYSVAWVIWWWRHR
ncbi:hypothetical protein PQU92_05935 [Asticcacaulis sp. BYS171W]|uniref:MotA/TolQ/ExbB proton channel domain-containing protein n=1 Tax=Asticcacaulis aquaticus TaxID=2984212 RepID=A0ABT5HTJ6_9CAUL|nr:hypothetical protein [Asticcacaulis aquaticus]MDC7682806.1 hypothetical protein [Asticcacaulis aquaticus]